MSPTEKEDVLRILLLEDSTFDAELITEHLARLGRPHEVTRAVSRRDFIAALERGGIDLILCDYSLPDFDGLSALEMSVERAPETPFIFVSGVLGEEIASEAFKRGATDYVLKQRLVRLPAVVERALAEARERRERRRAERQMEMLVGELSHRVKNTLATVISVVRRTARNVDTVEAYEKALLSRLHAIADAHALLFEANWGATDLRQVLERTMKPFGRGEDEAVSLDGPPVELSPKAALALSLVFHELITNAVKYGALSSDEGQVRAEWRIVGNGSGNKVEFRWQESGGPEVTAPQSAGFGTTLVQRSIAYELDGETSLDYAPDGLVCELSFPL